MTRTHQKVAVFSGTRAEYGLLYWLLKDIENDPWMTLQLLVSGMHLSPEFGCTYKKIEEDGFEIDEKIEILTSSDSAVGTLKSIGLGVIGFSDALNRLKPDVIVILGDRFEALAAAQAAMFLKIPIIHLHGGEVTEGAYDDAIRHAITKLSYLHGTSTEEYRRRVIQLGESPERVKNIGAIGLDHLQRTKLLELTELGKSLQFGLSDRYFVVTYHPVTLADEDPTTSFQSILDVLDTFSEYQVILTYPNADDGGRLIIPMIEEYARSQPKRVLAIPSLGQLRYLSAVKHASAVIGNSSSGIIEVPSFNVATINIGDRQKGRLAANSVVQAKANFESIKQALDTALSQTFLDKLGEVENPYGRGNSSEQVIEMIKGLDFNPCKPFFDINF